MKSDSLILTQNNITFYKDYRNFKPVYSLIKIDVCLSAAIQSYKEAYICDIAILKQRLQGLTSSMSDCSIVMETTRVWSNEDEEEEEDNMSVTGQQEVEKVT